MRCKYKKHINNCDRLDLHDFHNYIITLYQSGFIKRKYYDYIRKLIDNQFDVLRKERSLF